MKNDDLGNRMKDYYENRTKQFLLRRCNTIIRLDGKAFHTYTRKLNKPFDDGLIQDMQSTAIYLCKNIQGCKTAYTQSDEISLILTDYDNIQTDAWFNSNVQKMTSVAASMATAKFNELRLIRYFSGDDNMNISKGEYDRGVGEHFLAGTNLEEVRDDISSIINYLPLNNKLALFDARVFQIGENEEVVNYFIWRQQDAIRNSVSMLAQSLFSHKELHGISTQWKKNMCRERGHNWDELEYSKQRGSLILKNEYIDNYLVLNDFIYFDENKTRSKYVSQYVLNHPEFSKRTKWEVVETPIFTEERNIILNLLTKN